MLRVNFFGWAQSSQAKYTSKRAQTYLDLALKNLPSAVDKPRPDRENGAPP